MKRTELRRRFARFAENRDVFVYVTSPERALRGGFRVDRVWKGSPDGIWNEISAFVGIDRPDFDAYYCGSPVAYALGIADVWEFESPVCLEELRDRLGRFVVPQSWRYLRDSEVQLFQHMRVHKELQLIPKLESNL